jgi:hypothetical protein
MEPQSASFTGEKRQKDQIAGNKMALLPRRHSYEPSALRHCREAT